MAGRGLHTKDQVLALVLIGSWDPLPREIDSQIDSLSKRGPDYSWTFLLSILPDFYDCLDYAMCTKHIFVLDISWALLPYNMQTTVLVNFYSKTEVITYLQVRTISN